MLFLSLSLSLKECVLLWFCVRINTVKSRFKTWEMTCKYAMEYYLRLLYVPLCVQYTLLHHNYAILSLLSPPSYHRRQQQQHKNTVFIHWRKLKFQFQFCAHNAVCMGSYSFEPTIFMALFPFIIRIRIICLFTLNPSSCIWLDLRLKYSSSYAQILFMFLCNFPKHHTAAHKSCC